MWNGISIFDVGNKGDGLDLQRRCSGNREEFLVFYDLGAFVPGVTVGDIIVDTYVQCRLTSCTFLI